MNIIEITFPFIILVIWTSLLSWLSLKMAAAWINRERKSDSRRRSRETRASISLMFTSGKWINVSRVAAWALPVSCRSFPLISPRKSLVLNPFCRSMEFRLVPPVFHSGTRYNAFIAGGKWLRRGSKIVFICFWFIMPSSEPEPKPHAAPPSPSATWRPLSVRLFALTLSFGARTSKAVVYKRFIIRDLCAATYLALCHSELTTVVLKVYDTDGGEGDGSRWIKSSPSFSRARRTEEGERGRLTPLRILPVTCPLLQHERVQCHPFSLE